MKSLSLGDAQGANLNSAVEVRGLGIELRNQAFLASSGGNMTRIDLNGVCMEPIVPVDQFLAIFYLG